jgi:hypothetical protein
VRWEEVKSSDPADGRDATRQSVDTVSHIPGIAICSCCPGNIMCRRRRYSYTKTLARPDYHQLSPHFNMDYTQSNVWAGNPRLVPAEATNHDVFITLYSNELGLLSLGGFYKEVKNFTYYTQYALHNSPPPGLDSVLSYSVRTGSGTINPKDGAQLYTYTNSPHCLSKVYRLPDTALVLPAPLNGIVWEPTTRISNRARSIRGETTPRSLFRRERLRSLRLTARVPDG